MQIKSPGKKETGMIPFQGSVLPKLALVLSLICLIFFFGASYSMIYFGKGVSPVDYYISGLTKNLKYAVLGNSVQVDKFGIYLQDKDFRKLSNKRDDAVIDGILISNDDDYVPARIEYGNKTLNVKLRLKGDWADHLEGDKWSFRIKVERDETLAGLKEFSIQAPETRNYLNEWVFQKAVRRENIISLRYDFVDVSINGVDKGIYALEENFDKRLIENNGLREAPIIRFNEDLLWQGRLENNCLPEESYFSSVIDTFQDKGLSESPELKEQYLTAKDLLESYRDGLLNVSDVFDAKMASFMALSDVFGAYHGLIWHNRRFYYNPVTSLLEPIAFDSMAGDDARTNGLNGINQGFPAKDPFWGIYVKELERISKKAYLDDFFGEIGEELGKKEGIIKSDYPEYEFTRSVYYSNQEYIRKMLNPIKGINAYFYNNTEDVITLEIGSVQQMPVEVTGLMCREKTFKPLGERVFLDGKRNAMPVDYSIVQFNISGKEAFLIGNISDCTVVYQLLGHSRVRTETIIPYPAIDPKFASEDYIRNHRSIENNSYDYLVVDSIRHLVSFKPGDWMIEKDLIIPPGYEVYCFGDTSLDLRNNSVILSYSPLYFKGESDSPIVITSSDGSGQGIAVIKALNESAFEWTIFSRLTPPSKNGWQLTGGLTFYQSPAVFDHCIFKENLAGDDMINIFRSNFVITYSRFMNALSDCLDVDFGNGRVENSTFNDCRGDSMDYSGTTVKVAGCNISGSGDKGISCGEQSEAEIRSLKIQNSRIGLAVKDLSYTRIFETSFINCSIGITAYQKKPEYGPGSVYMDSLYMKDVGKEYLFEEGSTVLANSTRVNIPESREKKVYQLLYDLE